MDVIVRTRVHACTRGKQLDQNNEKLFKGFSC